MVARAIAWLRPMSRASGFSAHLERTFLMRMTLDEARHLIIEGINYAAYRETDSSLHDADKNRLWGSDHYNSDRSVAKPSPWAEGDFEGKMATLLHWANALNRSVPAFKEAQRLLEGDDSVIGRVIRQAGSQGFGVFMKS